MYTIPKHTVTSHLLINLSKIVELNTFKHVRIEMIMRTEQGIVTILTGTIKKIYIFCIFPAFLCWYNRKPVVTFNA